MCVQMSWKDIERLGCTQSGEEEKKKKNKQKKRKFSRQKESKLAFLCLFTVCLSLNLAYLNEPEQLV